jgi:hypothetical protein
MTVQELIDKLEDYGGHLPVLVNLSLPDSMSGSGLRLPEEMQFDIDSVDGGTVHIADHANEGMMGVVLAATMEG